MFKTPNDRLGVNSYHLPKGRRINYTQKRINIMDSCPFKLTTSSRVIDAIRVAYRYHISLTSSRARNKPRARELLRLCPRAHVRARVKLYCACRASQPSNGQHRVRCAQQNNYKKKPGALTLVEGKEREWK